ncbi:hypothetical protein GTR00_15825, partial [Kineococcus sp. T90]|nr:hypothetical protein [Kineococcus indalonis]
MISTTCEIVVTGPSGAGKSTFVATLAAGAPGAHATTGTGAGVVGLGAVVVEGEPVGAGEDHPAHALDVAVQGGGDAGGVVLDDHCWSPRAVAGAAVASPTPP